ncbi:uncharacterized protein LOC141764858 isoform X1 [Sebastes fasciatus]|uniref:uncharacterized protein LOC141764858 isoform X1 n=1 Tax=Sebastes fasciatus TaxID=394691 RepID=UPI003D9F2599
MGYTALYTLLWLLSAFTLTTQELLKLSVTPRITAECGQQVILNCDVSSSRDGLSVKYMMWSQNHTTFCSVDSEGKLKHHSHTQSDFHCRYKHGQLSLVFKTVQPRESGDSKRYMCKLQSNMGVAHAYTRLELQECCGIVKGILTNGGPICRFKNVYPDGDVHWFHGSHNLSDGSVTHHTTKQVAKGGWLTIESYLEAESSHLPYNCSLKSTASGRYIASTLVQNPESQVKPRGIPQEQKKTVENGAGSHGPMWTFLCISISLVVALK